MSQASTHAAPVFSAALHDVRYFANILRGIQFSNRAVVSLLDAGLRISVERARVLSADAYLPSTMFDEHKYTAPPHTDDEDPTETRFEVPLNVLVEVLNIFGSGFASTLSSSQSSVKRLGGRGGDSDSDDGQGKIDHYFGKKDKDTKKTGMRMSYAGEGHPLTLLLSEEAAGPKTTCEIKTLEPDEMVDIPFDDDRKVAKIIMKSSWLRDALSELDSWSCRDITFICTPAMDPSTRPTKGKHTQTPAQPTLRIHAAGTFGSTEMDYPNDREVLESFECLEDVSFTYKFSHISHCIQALRSSSKASLRIDNEGLLSLQLMMPTTKTASDGATAFIEFRCMPQDEIEGQ